MNDFLLEFDTYFGESFNNNGLAYGNSNTYGFMDFGEYHSTGSSTVMYTHNAGVIHFTAIPLAQTSTINDEVCSGSNAVSEYTDFMDAMEHSEGVLSTLSDPTGNTLWKNIKWTDHNGSVHDWSSSNTTYDDFGTLHSEIDLSLGYDHIVCNEFETHY